MSAFLGSVIPRARKTVNLEHYLAVFERLKVAFPPLATSDLNHRTIEVWSRYWLRRQSTKAIATEFGWSVAAVCWHLRRADRALKEQPPTTEC